MVSCCPPSAEASLYAVFIAIPLLGGLFSFLSSDNTPAATRWRNSLRKSRLTPPAGATAIIWVTLYICMGHASHIIYVDIETSSQPSSVISPCSLAYITQCLLNHFFIIVLFGLQRVDLALLMMVPLWLSTAITTLLFYEAAPLAGFLMMPVLVWVSFNVYLNAFLVWWNPIYTQSDMPFPIEDSKLFVSAKRKIS